MRGDGARRGEERGDRCHFDSFILLHLKTGVCVFCPAPNSPPQLSPPSQEIPRAGARVRIFEGGLPLASSAVDAGLYGGPDVDCQVQDGEDGFKFFFNYVEIAHKELEDINRSRQNKVSGVFLPSDDDSLSSLSSLSSSAWDGWLCLDFDDASLVLSNSYSRGECYKKILASLRSQQVAYKDGYTI